MPIYINDPTSEAKKQGYEILEQLAETVTYLQHHDGVSGTSKYNVMDKYEMLAEKYIDLTK